MTPWLGSMAECSSCPVESSGQDSPITQAAYLRCALQVGWVYLSLVLELWLLLSGQWEVFYPGQSVARTGYDHWPPTIAIHEGSAVQGQGSSAGHCLYLSIHWLCWPWSFPGSAGKGQPQTLFCLGSSWLSYKAPWDGCCLCWTRRFPGKAKLWI